MREELKEDFRKECLSKSLETLRTMSVLYRRALADAEEEKACSILDVLPLLDYGNTFQP